MSSICIILFLFFTCPIYSQSNSEAHIFNDTSLYFIRQIDSLNPVSLSATELTELEKFLTKAIDEFNQSQKRYADSVNPKKKRNRQQATYIDINQYFFKLVPRYNKANQKEVRISSDIKYFFMTGKRKNPTYDPEWKRKFIKGTEVLDGGSSFIYLIVNLTLKNHGQLTMNGVG